MLLKLGFHHPKSRRTLPTKVNLEEFPIGAIAQLGYAIPSEPWKAHLEVTDTNRVVQPLQAGALLPNAILTVLRVTGFRL